jgi:hypothetical protein
MTLRELTERLREHQGARQALLAEVSDFMEGDFYRDGKAFDGPATLEGNETLASIHNTVMKLVPNYFTVKDVVGKGCARHAENVVGKEPKWNWLAEEERTDGTKTLDELYLEWWDETHFLSTLEEGTTDVLWAYDAPKRDGDKKFTRTGDRTSRTPRRTSVVLRFHYPKKFQRREGKAGDTFKPKGTFDEILGKTRIQKLEPLASGVVRDDDGEPLFGYYSYALDKWERLEAGASQETELSILWDDAPVEIKELAKNGGEGKTIHCIMRDDKPVSAVCLELNGQLTFYELTRKPLVTAASLNLQRKINLLSTILSINAGDGVGITILKNAVPPGKWYIKGDSGEQQVSMWQAMLHDDPSKVRFEPQAIGIGSGNIISLQGAAKYALDNDGNPVFVDQHDPKFEKTQPFDTEAIRSDRDAFIRDFYEEIDQLHILSSSDGGMSEDSRKQQASIFINSLRKTGTTVEGAIRWALSITRDFAAYFSNDATYQAFRPYAAVTLSGHVTTPADKKDAREAAKEGFISIERARVEQGVDDPTSEVEVIENEENDPINVKAQEQIDREQENLDKTLKAKGVKNVKKQK